MRRTLAAIGVVTLLVTVAPTTTAQAASYKSCGPAIKSQRFGQAYRIRVTKGFPCRSVRNRIRRWLKDGASYGTRMPPWTCTMPYRRRGTYSDLNRCRIRTSFGGTKPLRTYRLGFIYSIRS